MPDPLVIRSYRTVFAFERRLYRIDRWRVPLPGGVPVRALLYAPVAVAALVVLSRVPLVGVPLTALPDPVRLVLVPGALVVAAVRLRLDGRPAHRAAWAMARWSCERRWLAGLRPCPPPFGRVALTGTLTVRPDHRGVVYRAGTVRGPARVLVRGPAALDGTPRDPACLRLTPQAGRAARRGRIVDVPAGARIVVR